MTYCPWPRLGLLLAVLTCLAWTATSQAEAPRIGAEDDWYPYTAWRDGQIQGMSVDIVRAAFAASATTIELSPYPYSRCMELARSGQLAACLNTTLDSHIVADFLIPEEPLFRDDILLWARSGASPLQRLDELVGKQVAVTLGYTYGEYFDSYPGILRVPVRRDLNGFLMLQRGRIDYVVAFRGTAQALLQEYPELAEQFTEVGTVHQSQLYLTFSRRHPEAAGLRLQFDQGMRQIRADGTYQRILEHWQLAQRQSQEHTATLQ